MSMTPKELKSIIKKLEKEIEELKVENEKLKNNSVQKIKNERNAGRKTKINDDIIRTVTMLRLQNKSIRYISKEINLSVGTLQKIINEYIKWKYINILSIKKDI